MGDAAFSLSCVVRETRVEHRQDGVGGAAVSITPRMSWKGRARARASCVPLAPAWRTPLRRRRATRDVARNLRPPRSHARRALRPRVTLCRAMLFPPSTFRGPHSFRARDESFANRERLHSPHLRPCDFRPFTETTTHAVDSSRARRRGGVRSRGRVAARCRVASLSAAAGDRRGYPAA